MTHIPQFFAATVASMIAAPAQRVPCQALILLWRAEPCARCEMVCVDATLGRRVGPEPLLTLAKFRRSGGRINFGLIMDRSQPAPDGPDEPHVLEVGMPVQPQARPVSI